MTVQLMQKTASDQEVYSLVAEFASEDAALAYIKEQQLQGLFKTFIPLHTLACQQATFTQLDIVATPCA